MHNTDWKFPFVEHELFDYSTVHILYSTPMSFSSRDECKDARTNYVEWKKGAFAYSIRTIIVSGVIDTQKNVNNY